MSGLRVVACLPAFNEERYIASVLVRVRGLVDGVIVCYDGSVGLDDGYLWVVHLTL